MTGPGEAPPGTVGPSDSRRFSRRRLGALSAGVAGGAVVGAIAGRLGSVASKPTAASRMVDASAHDSVDGAAREAFAGGQLLYFPAGNYRYDGPGLDPGGSFAVLGDPGAVIDLADDAWFIDATTPIPSSSVVGVRFKGGEGGIRFRGAGVEGDHYVERVQCLGYRGAAIAIEALAPGRLRIRDCTFVAADYRRSMGLAVSDGTVDVETSDFLLNRVDVKLAAGRLPKSIRNCSFIRRAGDSPLPRARVWVVPDGGRDDGTESGLSVLNSKFGNENMIRGDLQILFADEGTGSGIDSRMPLLDVASRGSVTGQLYAHNNFASGWGQSGSAPIVFSATAAVQILIDDNVYQGLTPSALVSFSPALRMDPVPVSGTRWTVDDTRRR